MRGVYLEPDGRNRTNKPGGTHRPPYQCKKGAIGTSGSKQEDYWASIEVPIRPVKQLKIAILREKCVLRVQEVFSAHGIILEIKEDHCVVILPDGTTSQEILPRLNYSSRHRITLPDGYEMREVIQRNSPYSYLGLPDQDFSDC